MKDSEMWMLGAQEKLQVQRREERDTVRIRNHRRYIRKCLRIRLGDSWHSLRIAELAVKSTRA